MASAALDSDIPAGNRHATGALGGLTRWPASGFVSWREFRTGRCSAGRYLVAEFCSSAAVSETSSSTGSKECEVANILVANGMGKADAVPTYIGKKVRLATQKLGKPTQLAGRSVSSPRPAQKQ